MKIKAMQKISIPNIIIATLFILFSKYSEETNSPSELLTGKLWYLHSMKVDNKKQDLTQEQKNIRIQFQENGNGQYFESIEENLRAKDFKWSYEHDHSLIDFDSPICFQHVDKTHNWGSFCLVWNIENDEMSLGYFGKNGEKVEWIYTTKVSKSTLSIGDTLLFP